MSYSKTSYQEGRSVNNSLLFLLSSTSSRPCQGFLFHSRAAHKRLRDFSPVSHSQPMLAALWTELNAELPPIPSQHGIHPDPTEKLLMSCSHTMPTALSKSNPNNAHPQFITTSEPKRKLADHTSIWATLNVKRPTYMHTQKKMLITSIHMNKEGDKTEWAGCDGDWHYQHSNTKLILLFALHFPLILPPFPFWSLKRARNRMELCLNEGCVCVIKFQTRPAQQWWPCGQKQSVGWKKTCSTEETTL